jgi:hypothetical protein
MGRFTIIGFLLALLAVAALTAPRTLYAQAPPQAPQGGPSSEASPQKSGKSTEVPLSKKLDQSEGVLSPPGGVDPKMNKDPPPKTGDKMLVIIPPGEPGGDQSVQPK